MVSKIRLQKLHYPHYLAFSNNLTNTMDFQFTHSNPGSNLCDMYGSAGSRVITLEAKTFDSCVSAKVSVYLTRRAQRKGLLTSHCFRLVDHGQAKKVSSAPVYKFPFGTRTTLFKLLPRTGGISGHKFFRKMFNPDSGSNYSVPASSVTPSNDLNEASFVTTGVDEDRVV